MAEESCDKRGIIVEGGVIKKGGVNDGDPGTRPQMNTPGQQQQQSQQQTSTTPASNQNQNSSR